MPSWIPIPLDYEKYAKGTETFVNSKTTFDASSFGKSTTATDRERQDHFLRTLRNIAWHLGTDDVPVFVSFNGDDRRMDKGCIGHAVAAGAIEAPKNGPDGYVVAVTLLNRQHGAPEAIGLRQFKEDYRTYVLGKYKRFHLTLQTGRDREYYFTAEGFPSYVRLKHSFVRSSVILVFEGPWKDVATETLKDIPNSMTIEHHDRTLDLVAKTQPIDFTKPVEGQSHLIDSAMEAAERLLPYAALVQQATFQPK